MTTTEELRYEARLVWDGNTGQGTAEYRGYGRRHRVLVPGKPELAVTADPAFGGEAEVHNPEELLLAAIAGCHMLTYLALCARSGVRVVAYEDDVRGTLRLRPDGGGSMVEVVLRPTVTVAREEQAALALRLHDAAHERCFVAASCRVPIRHEATVQAIDAHAGSRA